MSGNLDAKGPGLFEWHSNASHTDTTDHSGAKGPGLFEWRSNASHTDTTDHSGAKGPGLFEWRSNIQLGDVINGETVVWVASDGSGYETA